MTARRSAVPLEKVEQQWGTDTLRLLKFKVYTLGHARRGAICSRCHQKVFSYGTQQTEGTPDVFAFSPIRFGRRELLWWEVKRERGSRSSPEQVEFAQFVADIGSAHVHHVCGPFNALIEWLIEYRWARADQFPSYRQPQEIRS